VDENKLFAKRVRKLRKAANLSLAKASERGDLTQNHWGEVERGNKEPWLEIVFKIARGLNITPGVLLALEREEDERSLRKRMESLLDKCSPQQLELVHRVAKVIVEP
jgi:transcriptional regulator with XRE-family HTH domain